MTDFKKQGVGLRALTEKELLKKEIEDIKQYVYQEFEDIKQVIRELRQKLDEVLEQMY